MKKTGVTKRTWNKNARKFAMESTASWRDLNAFVKSHCKGGEKKRAAFLDELCPIIDRYIHFNCEILMWCHKNGVDPRDFVCDVVNLGCGNLD